MAGWAPGIRPITAATSRSVSTSGWPTAAAAEDVGGAARSATAAAAARGEVMAGEGGGGGGGATELPKQPHPPPPLPSPAACAAAEAADDDRLLRRDTACIASAKVLPGGRMSTITREVSSRRPPYARTMDCSRETARAGSRQADEKSE
jgi:hypothetical protein